MKIFLDKNVRLQVHEVIGNNWTDKHDGEFIYSKQRSVYTEKDTIENPSRTFLPPRWEWWTIQIPHEEIDMIAFPFVSAEYDLPVANTDSKKVTDAYYKKFEVINKEWAEKHGNYLWNIWYEPQTGIVKVRYISHELPKIQIESPVGSSVNKITLDMEVVTDISTLVRNEIDQMIIDDLSKHKRGTL